MRARWLCRICLPGQSLALRLLLLHDSEPLHYLRHVCVIHVALMRSAIEFGIDVVSAVARGLCDLDGHGMRLLPGILANARYLPGNLEACCTTGDAEGVVLNFLRDMQGGSRGSDRRQLITEVAVQRLEPAREMDRGLAVFVEHRIAAVEIERFRRLERCVIEIFVCRVKRMIDPEALGARYHEVARDADVAGERTGQTIHARRTARVRRAADGTDPVPAVAARRCGCAVGHDARATGRSSAILATGGDDSRNAGVI